MRYCVNSRIAGGDDVIAGKIPWMAVVKVWSKLSKSYGTCGGALITVRHVLTAAHCLLPATLKLKGWPAENNIKVIFFKVILFN